MYLKDASVHGEGNGSSSKRPPFGIHQTLACFLSYFRTWFLEPDSNPYDMNLDLETFIKKLRMLVIVVMSNE